MNKWPDSYPDIQGPPPGIDDLLRRLFPDKMVAKDEHCCPFCRKVVTGQAEFRDELSWREFLITGLCQTCQDEFAASETDEEPPDEEPDCRPPDEDPDDEEYYAVDEPEPGDDWMIPPDFGTGAN